MIRCGTDLIKIERITKACQRLGEPFLERIWTRQELDACLQGKAPDARAAASLAGRFAVKEAVAKALGTGIGREGVQWTDISVQQNSNGAPYVSLSGNALACFERLGGLDIAISISHEKEYALAMCVIDLK